MTRRPLLHLVLLLSSAVAGATALPGLPAPVAQAAVPVATAAAAAPEGTAPTGLSVNGIGGPVDVEGTPLFGWHVETDRQTAYQVVVASTEAAAAAGEGDLWDSGRTDGGVQRGVAYAGEALATSERYWWSVRTWDAGGEASAWSRTAVLGTGPGGTWSSSTPIWTPAPADNWTDYTVETDFTVVANAATITFHTTSASAFYMWQIRSDTNMLRTHYGTTFLDQTPLADKGITIANGETHRLRIEAVGPVVRTWIDDVLVRSGNTHSTYPVGGVGFRTGNSERATFDNLRVTDPAGTVLYSNDFSAAVPELPSLAVADGKLVVAPSKFDYVPGSWSNYTITSKVTVDQVATGLTFRATDASNSYLWQLRGADNQLKPHKQVAGAYTALKTVDLPAGTLAIGKRVEVRIEVVGTTIRTWIDGVQVDTTTDTTFRRGVVGVRNGLTEAATLDDYTVVDRNTGRTLVSDTFDTANRTFACGSVTAGALTVGNGQVCLIRGLSNSWAFLRDEVTLADKEIAWGSLYATGANARTAKQYVHKVYVNGEFVGLGPTQPIGTETRYDGYDVTGLLRSGEPNVLGALAYTTNTQKFQAELVVEYVDGTRDVLGTGPSWTALNGEATFPAAGSIGTSYFVAPKENLDAREFPWGWDEPGFDDGAWVGAEQRPAIGQLAATPTDKVQEQLRDAVEVVDRGNGTYVVDFGRTWIGGVSYTVDGVAGTPVELRFGEVKNPDGSVRYALNTGNSYRDVVTLKDGEQTLETWGARVFRYVEIVGAPEPVTVESLKALALVYPFDAEASTFSASDPDIEAVYELSKNTIESLNLNFYTDSWTRERTNYEADGYLQQMSTLYLMDDLSLATYSMDYFKNNRTWPTEWPMYVVLAVRDAWRQTGDTSQMTAYYGQLQDKLPTEWVEESTGLVRKNTGVGCSSQTDCDIVDWPTSERDGYQFKPYNTVVNALSYRAFRDMAEIAGALGKDADQASYTAVADRLRDAMNERLYDPTTGSYDDGLDANGVRTGHSALHASAFALAFGVPEADQATAVATHVASRGMACSVYCAAFLVKGLYDGGNGQAALDMLTTGTGVRSWLHMIELGAGSTAEAWDPSLKSNLTYSHPWAASPAFNVPSGLFGIQPEGAGYETFRVKPQPGDLDWATITTPTVRGSVGAAFDHGADGDLRLVASVPGNTTARLSLPTEETGPTTVYVDGVARTVTPVDGFVTVRRVTPGCHLVTTEADVVPDARLTDVCDDEPATGATVSAAVTPSGAQGWSGIGATLTLTADDAPVGATVEYAVDGGDWTAYTGPVELAAGQYAVAHRLVDDGDVVLEGSTDVKVDLTAPTAAATLGADRAVTVTGVDDASGPAGLEIRVDGGDWTAYAEPVPLDAAAHAVEARATDVAGNVGEVLLLEVPAVPAPVATSAPTVTGDAAWGRTLTATPGEWDTADLAFGYQWLLDGVALDGATAPEYRVRGRDVGGRLSVRVTARGTSLDDGTATSEPTAVVARTPSTLRLRVRDEVRAGRPFTVRVRISTDGYTPKGKVTISIDGRELVRRLSDGRVTVTVRVARPGRYVVGVDYPGNRIADAVSGSDRVRVTSRR